MPPEIGNTLQEERTAITISAAGLIFARLIPPGLNQILISVMARAFGSNFVGSYFLPLTWLSIFHAFAILGVGDVVAREAGRFPERSGQYLINGLMVGLVSSVAAGIAMGGIVRFFHYPQEIEPAIQILSASLLPITVISVAEGLYISRQKTKYIVLVSFFETFLTVGLNLLFLFLGYGLLTLMGITVIVRTLSATTHLFIIHRKIARVKFQVDSDLLRPLLSPTIVFGLGKILVYIFLKASAIILSKFQTIEEVGLYIAASRLMEVLMIMPHAFGFAAFPLMARKFSVSPESAREILIHTAKRLSIIAIPTVVGIVLFSEQIVWLLYGQAFAGAVPALKLLMLSILLTCGDNLLANTCRAVGHQNIDLAILVAAVVVNVSLSLMLIPHHGLLGACYAILISLSVSLFTHWYYVNRRIFKLDLMGAMFKAFALVIPLTLAVVVFAGT